MVASLGRRRTLPPHSKRLLSDPCPPHVWRAPGAGEARATTELCSFGRRRGRRLSARQLSLMNCVLPRLSLDLAAAPRSLASLFSTPVSEFWLEVGFGGGEHLIWQARHNPHVGFIGCEPFEDGIVKVLAAIEEHALTNIRLHANDARPLLRWLPNAALQRAFILFRIHGRRGGMSNADWWRARRLNSLPAYWRRAVSSGWRPILAIMPVQSCTVLVPSRPSSGTPQGLPIGANASPIGRKRAMRPRLQMRAGVAIFFDFAEWPAPNPP